MKKYSVPRQVWRAANFPLMYIGMQIVISFIATFVYGFYLGFKEASTGNTNINQTEMADKIKDFVLQYALVFTLISAVICLIILFFVWNKERKVENEPYSKIKPLNILIIIGLALSLQFLLSSFFSILDITKYFPSYEELSEVLFSGGFIIQVVCIGIVVPIVEELCFRGLVFNRLKRSTPLWIALGIQAIIFGLIHMNLLQGLYAGIIGIVFALLYHKFKNLWASITAHITLNLSAVFITEYASEEFLANNAILLLVVSLITTALFGMLIIRQFSNKTTDFISEKNDILV